MADADEAGAPSSGETTVAEPETQPKAEEQMSPREKVTAFCLKNNLNPEVRESNVFPFALSHDALRPLPAPRSPLPPSRSRTKGTQTLRILGT